MENSVVISDKDEPVSLDLSSSDDEAIKETKKSKVRQTPTDIHDFPAGIAGLILSYFLDDETQQQKIA